MLALGAGSKIGSLSSRDIRFSAAVKLPCDKGDGRAGRGVETAADVDVGAVDADVEEVVGVDDDGDSAAGRVDVAVAVDVADDDDEPR